jgi:hypothetical protein
MFSSLQHPNWLRAQPVSYLEGIGDFFLRAKRPGRYAKHLYPSGEVQGRLSLCLQNDLQW